MWCVINVCLSFCLHLSLRLFVCMSVYFRASALVSLSIRPFVYSSIHLSDCMPAVLCCVLCVCTCLFVCVLCCLSFVCCGWLVIGWLGSLGLVGWLVCLFARLFVCMSYCLTVCDVFDACISPGVCIIILMYDELWHYVNWCMYVPCVPVCLCANVCMYVCHVCDWLCVYVRSTHVIVIVFDSWYHLSCGWHLRTPDFDCLTPDYWLTLALND